MRISDWSSDVCSSDLFQIEQACGQKRCACSKDDIPFFPDRSHTSHAGKNHSSYPGFQLTQCLSDRRCDMGGRYFQHFRSEEHTYELQSLMRISYAVFCFKKKINTANKKNTQS